MSTLSFIGVKKTLEGQVTGFIDKTKVVGVEQITSQIANDETYLIIYMEGNVRFYSTLKLQDFLDMLNPEYQAMVKKQNDALNSGM